MWFLSCDYRLLSELCDINANIIFEIKNKTKEESGKREKP